MAPNILEWHGITLSFYSNEHDPIHVHVYYAEFVSIFELYVENGKVIQIAEREMDNEKPLPPQQSKQALKLINKYKYEIIEDLYDFHTLHKKIKFKKIRKKKL